MPTGPNETLRVVLDTNVYISAFTNTKGKSFRVWIASQKRHYHLLTSLPIVREMARVFRREKFAWTETEITNQVRLVAKAAQIITPTITLAVIPEDPPDNRILECAVEGRAHMIVSGNRHLTRLNPYQGIAIVNSMTFLRTLVISFAIFCLGRIIAR